MFHSGRLQIRANLVPLFFIGRLYMHTHHVNDLAVIPHIQMVCVDDNDVHDLLIRQSRLAIETFWRRGWGAW